MTVRQWFQFLEYCQQTALYNEIKRRRGGIVNFYDIDTYFVQPWTRGHGCGVSLLMNPEEQLDPQFMISHGWGADVEEDMECLQSLDRDCVIWFCVFANYQCNDGHGPSIADQLALDPFESIIAFVQNVEDGAMLALHSSTVDIYTRMWCVLEISTALAMDVPVIAKVSRSWAVSEISRQGQWGEIDTAAAKCGDPGDMPELRRKIREQGGFQVLNRTIHNFRVQSLRASRV